jgi:hypothetical protein
MTVNTYQISLTPGGAAINTSGTQSGVQTRTMVPGPGLYNVFDSAGTLGFMGYASNYLYGFVLGLDAGSVAHTISDKNVFDSTFQGMRSYGGSINGTNFFKNITDAWAVAPGNSVEFGRLVGDSAPVKLLDTTGRSGVGSVIRDGFEWPLSAAVNVATTAVPFVQMPTLMFGRIRIRAGGDNASFGYYSATLKYDGTTLSVADVTSKVTGTFVVAAATPFTIVGTGSAAQLAFNCSRSDGPKTQAFTFDFDGEYYKE